MKVLTAHVAVWFLLKAGSLAYNLACRLLEWGDDVQDWAGIGDEDVPWGGTD